MSDTGLHCCNSAICSDRRHAGGPGITNALDFISEFPCYGVSGTTLRKCSFDDGGIVTGSIERVLHQLDECCLESSECLMEIISHPLTNKPVVLTGFRSESRRPVVALPLRFSWSDDGTLPTVSTTIRNFRPVVVNHP